MPPLTIRITHTTRTKATLLCFMGMWEEWFRIHTQTVRANGGFGVGHSLTVECLAAQLEGIDLTSQCYVTGVLSFDWNTSHIEWPIAALGPGHCVSRGFFLNIVDIHN